MTAPSRGSRDFEVWMRPNGIKGQQLYETSSDEALSEDSDVPDPIVQAEETIELSQEYLDRLREAAGDQTPAQKAIFERKLATWTFPFRPSSPYAGQMLRARLALNAPASASELRGESD